MDQWNLCQRPELVCELHSKTTTEGYRIWDLDHLTRKKPWLMEVSAVFWVQDSFCVLIRFQKRTESLPLRVILPSENADHGREHRQRLRSYTVVCVRVLLLVGGSWRERERDCYYLGGTLLCVWMDYGVSTWLVKAQTRVRVGSGRHIGHTDTLILRLVLPACITIPSAWKGSF